MKHINYRADVDGLRAIAVLSVVIFHAFPDALKGGFVGVDVFFVISGFLISTLILENLERDCFSFVEFYSRRVKRLFPALVVVLAACLVVGWFALLPNDYKQLGKHVAGAAAFVANFVLWNESGYFDTAADLKPLRHLWSLGIEEQFYLAWPVFLWMARRLQLSPINAVLVVGGISFAYNLQIVFNDEVAAFYSPLTRLWELLSGAALAAVALRNRSVGHANIRSLLGASLLGAGLLTITGDHFFPGWWALLPTVGAVLVISSGSDAWLNRVVLSHPVLVWFGLISYPLYLWHWPLLVFARIIEDDEPILAVRITAIVLSVALAAATYLFIEKPVRLGSKGRQKVLALLFLMLAVGSAGYICHRLEGLQSRSFIGDLQQSRSYLAWPKDYERTSSCVSRFPDSGYCVLAGDMAPTIALIGDSHANHFYPGLARAYARADEVLVQLGNGGCPPLLDVSSGYPGVADQCNNNSGNVLDLVARQAQIHTVILAAAWHFHIIGSKFGAGTADTPMNQLRSKSIPAVDRNVDVFNIQMKETIALLKKSGKKIIVIKQIPELGFSPLKCIGKNPFKVSAMRPECRVDAREVRRYLAEYEENFDRLFREIGDVLVIDPKPYFCDQTYCYVMNGDVPLHRDQWHLSVEGSRQFADKLSARDLLVTDKTENVFKPQ